jgi:antitoxin component of MazEF toxin-antitoxin module
MSNIKTTRIIRIGNARVVRLPRHWLQQLQLADEAEVEMALEGDQLVIRPKCSPRQGREEPFGAMHERGDDHLINGLPVTAWDETAWSGW